MATDNNDKAVLHYPGGEYELDIIKATEGNDGVVLGKMLADTGLVTYDPGYVSTGSCESEITYIDGENGVLRHRGNSAQRHQPGNGQGGNLPDRHECTLIEQNSDEAVASRSGRLAWQHDRPNANTGLLPAFPKR